MPRVAQSAFEREIAALQCARASACETAIVRRVKLMRRQAPFYTVPAAKLMKPM
jgi:hypothetical protein